MTAGDLSSHRAFHWVGVRLAELLVFVSLDHKALAAKIFPLKMYLHHAVLSAMFVAEVPDRRRERTPRSTRARVLLQGHDDLGRYM